MHAVGGVHQRDCSGRCRRRCRWRCPWPRCCWPTNVRSTTLERGQPERAWRRCLVTSPGRSGTPSCTRGGVGRDARSGRRRGRGLRPRRDVSTLPDECHWQPRTRRSRRPPRRPRRRRAAASPSCGGAGSDGAAGAAARSRSRPACMICSASALRPAPGACSADWPAAWPDVRSAGIRRVVHANLRAGSLAAPAALCARMVASPRLIKLRTVPMRQPRVSAICSSGRSWKIPQHQCGALPFRQGLQQHPDLVAVGESVRHISRVVPFGNHVEHDVAARRLSPLVQERVCQRPAHIGHRDLRRLDLVPLRIQLDQRLLHQFLRRRRAAGQQVRGAQQGSRVRANEPCEADAHAPPAPPRVVDASGGRSVAVPRSR